MQDNSIQKNAIDAVTLNDIIQRKLEGIVNKLEIDATTDQDRHTAKAVQQILAIHQKIGTHPNESR